MYGLDVDSYGRQHTMQPLTSGASVLGLSFNNGIIIAADILGSYGSLARFRQLTRVMKINDKIVLGCGGDYADYQFLSAIIEQKMIDEECLNDGFSLKPKSLHSWLTRILYNRRSKFDPLWTTFVVGGLQDNVPFLGHIDKIGTAYEANSIATGYGAYLAQPLLSEAYEKNPNMTEAEARALIVNCLQILFYRDARSFYKYQLAVVTPDGVKIEGPLELTSNWEVGLYSKYVDTQSSLSTT